MATVERVQASVIRLKDLPKLTNSQATFVDKILEGSTQSDAYRAAYDCESMAARTIWANASRLAKHDKVKAWLDWHRLELQDQAQVNLSGHLSTLMLLRDDAWKADDYGNAIRAETKRGEAAGLYQKHATITHMSLDTLPETVGKLPSQVIDAVVEDVEDNQ